ncbi:MAG TPA: sugar ABC transporter ATP-binding protein [Firmicutes bacterium]|nr:sugar ABC transporter ATP-binding protein [Bacillota bacterium]
MEINRNEIILELQNLSKSFGKNQVLKGVNLKIHRGTVMGLMGENGAGKSTMMRTIFGILHRDDGNIILDGKSINFNSPKEALENGIAMVHQELNQCLEMTVLDNMYLGRYPTIGGIIDKKTMAAEATALFKQLGIKVDLNAKMKTMAVAQRQMVEIAKAVSYKAKLIVLDEPTSSLTDNEVDKLFEIMKRLRDQGTSFFYISHKMDEVFKCCDEICVLRDGQMVMNKKITDTNLDEIIKAMVGRPLTNRFPPVDNTPGEDILEVKGLTSKFAPFLHDISFSVKKGEIFGIYGLVGAGRTETLECLFGLRTLSGGQIVYKGKVMDFHSAADAMKQGFALVTEERKANGLFLKESIQYNTCINNLGAYMSYHVLSNKMMEHAAEHEVEVMHTKCMSVHEKISALSGGNQQKVIIGRWLELEPDVFLMDEPTRGIDVGAKYEIYQLMINLAKSGKTIIMVSSEMPEILGVTNRIAVMSNHTLAGVVNTKETNQEELLRLCAKYM